MSEAREPMMVAAIGFMGVGKTYTTRQTVDEYIRSIDGHKARPVLAFDPNAEESYSDYKPIDFDVTEENDYKRGAQIRNIKAPGKYRILPYKKNRQPMGIADMQKTAVTICRYFRNGLLILEDINKYTGYTYTQDLVGMFIGLRHLGVDLILHFQNLRAVPTRIWTNMTYLRWHKQSDAIFKYKSRISNFELFSIAEQIVNIKSQQDIHYYLWLNNLQGKIEGVSLEDFKTGAKSYLLKNPAVLSRLMQEISESGQKKYKNSNEAMAGFIEEKTREYLDFEQ